MTAESYREYLARTWTLGEPADKYSNYIRVPINELRYVHILSWTKEGRPT